MSSNLPRTTLLILGDAAALLAVTLAGFATHQTSVASTRWLTTFIPLCIAWAVQAPWLGVYRVEVFTSLRRLWRPVLAVLLAAPLFGILRGAVLNAPVLPLFVAVLGLSAALGILVWRLVFALLYRQAGRSG